MEGDDMPRQQEEPGRNVDIMQHAERRRAASAHFTAELCIPLTRSLHDGLTRIEARMRGRHGRLVHAA
jgi:hypothetical protein